MNRRITRVAVAAVVMLGALIVGTTYWQTWASAGLADRQDNEIQRVAQFTIRRGTIYANDGTTVLAKNRVVKLGGQTLYYRVYPQRGLTAHVVGYSTVVRSQAGLEKSFNDYLTGANGNLSSVFRSTLNSWRGITVTGNDVYTTINAKAQKVALDALAGQCGAAVALNPRTGATLVIHLAIHTIDVIARELTPFYGADCPVVVVERASWPDQRIVRGILRDIGERLSAQPIERTALILIGPALAAEEFRESALYDPDYRRRFRGGAA